MSPGAPTLPRALVRLMFAVDGAYTAASRELGLTAQQAQLLCLAREAVSIGELADEMRCDRSNVSRMVDRAGDRGLLARRPDERDARVTVVELTDTGERLMRRFVGELEARIAGFVGGWPARQEREALTLLNALAEALERPAAPEPAHPAPARS